MKLAKAAAQQLKAVVVEYDVLCSTLLDKSSALQGEKHCYGMAAEKIREQKEQRVGLSLFNTTSIKSMLVRDARGLLKYLRKEDREEETLVLKEQLQSTFQGLPSQILERITSPEDKEKADVGTINGRVYLEKKLQSSLETSTKCNQQKKNARLKHERWSEEGFGVKSGNQTSSLRDKYLDKIIQLKKGQERSTMEREEIVGATTSAGLSTWVVNEGANEVLSYSNLRGLFKAVIPPRDPLQDAEYNCFLKEMMGQFDMFLPKTEQQKFPNPMPILYICKVLDLKPSDVLVLARHASTIKAAKDAKTHVCQYIPEDKVIPNHTAHYHLTHLKKYQDLIEDFNGISYRDKILLGSIEF
ncbi:unnamed protein product [Peronospora belbahrii]|uniref:Uncharacterized protein n=1 Tax=Peronospora belbahrii TaxID=622444 RepID=A0AAU9LEK5_9STRA|nr:unnamed protein product [Peronospora belbahrii]